MDFCLVFGMMRGNKPEAFPFLHSWVHAFLKDSEPAVLKYEPLSQAA